jgi:hypothetical protein
MTREEAGAHPAGGGGGSGVGISDGHWVGDAFRSWSRAGTCLHRAEGGVGYRRLNPGERGSGNTVLSGLRGAM